MRSITRTIFLIRAAFALVPTTAAAQRTLAGTVTDANGRALRGTTVDAAGPALSGKVRSAVTRRWGQFTIADLPAGTYSLTFPLPAPSSGARRRSGSLPKTFSVPPPTVPRTPLGLACPVG